jgi:hypothetical protein
MAAIAVQAEPASRVMGASTPGIAGYEVHAIPIGTAKGLIQV